MALTRTGATTTRAPAERVDKLMSKPISEPRELRAQMTDRYFEMTRTAGVYASAVETQTGIDAARNEMGQAAGRWDLTVDALNADTFGDGKG